MPAKGKEINLFLNLQVNFCPWVMVLFSIVKQRQHRKPSGSYRFILILILIVTLLLKLSVYFLAGSWLICVFFFVSTLLSKHCNVDGHQLQLKISERATR